MQEEKDQVIKSQKALSDQIENIITTLQDQIRELELETEDVIKFSEAAMKLALSTMEEVKAYVLSHPFGSPEEEINFFRNLKPRIASHYIYYNAVRKIEVQKPQGGEKVVRKHYECALAWVKSYFENNLDFYTYYRKNCTYLDDYYFLRNQFNIELDLDSYAFELDRSFSTSHDYKVAKIIANDRFQVYVESQLATLFRTYNHDQAAAPVSNLRWTASKSSLIELMYALHAEGAFNNGAADLKYVAENFERLFKIDLGQYHRVFLEIRYRKNSRTKYLDSLRERLITRMDEADEK